MFLGAFQWSLDAFNWAIFLHVSNYDFMLVLSRTVSGTWLRKGLI